MEQAAKDATTVLMQTGDGQLCDVIIDRATLEAIKQAGQEATNERLKNTQMTWLPYQTLK